MPSERSPLPGSRSAVPVGACRLPLACSSVRTRPAPVTPSSTTSTLLELVDGADGRGTCGGRAVVGSDITRGVHPPARSRSDAVRPVAYRPASARRRAVRPGDRAVRRAVTACRRTTRSGVRRGDHVERTAGGVVDRPRSRSSSNGRVAVGDDVGTILRSRFVVVLIGERPGLSVPESVGAYLTFEPTPGRTDAQRNCVSNIHDRGLVDRRRRSAHRGPRRSSLDARPHRCRPPRRRPDRRDRSVGT